MKTPQVQSLHDSQKELRIAFMGGFAGQLVSGIIWLIASIVSILLTPQISMIVLFFCCMFIFPLTKWILHLIGETVTVESKNKLYHLGAQVAFTVPINFLLVIIISSYNIMLFFPAVMIIVGSHYLPFITLYGMKLFGVLAAILIMGGTFLLFFGPEIFSIGGWFTGGTLIVFAFIGKSLSKEE